MNREAVLVALMAAGSASRFGGGKLDAQCAGNPVGRWALQAIAEAGLPPGICVTGPEPPRFLAGATDWERAINPAPENGLGSSIATAARVAGRRGSDALMVVLADMPLVTPVLLRELAVKTGPAATNYGAGRPGVPALFPADLFAALAECEGDRGGARLLAGLPDLELVAAPAGTLLDIDTQTGLAQAEARLRRG